MEHKSPSQTFEKVSKMYGRSFYEIACFLKSLNYIAPKLQVSDMEYLITKTDQNKVFNVAQTVLNFILRTCPAIIALDQ